MQPQFKPIDQKPDQQENGGQKRRTVASYFRKWIGNQILSFFFVHRTSSVFCQLHVINPAPSSAFQRAGKAPIKKILADLAPDDHRNRVRVCGHLLTQWPGTKDWLQVHWFPNRARLDIVFFKSEPDRIAVRTKLFSGNENNGQPPCTTAVFGFRHELDAGKTRQGAFLVGKDLSFSFHPLVQDP
jgi:hypothetical protein